MLAHKDRIPLVEPDPGGEHASRYTAVTYDPRGLSHSTLDEPLDDARMVKMFADDVFRLLDTIAGRKAKVFASSGGAVIALELAAGHPERLDVVVAHEPPSPAMLSNGADVLAAMEDISDTCNTKGLMPARQKFMTLAGIQGGGPPAPQGEPTPEEEAGTAQMMRNMELGMEAVVFPGDHGGFDGHPGEFAAKLREVLEGPSRK